MSEEERRGYLKQGKQKNKEDKEEVKLSEEWQKIEVHKKATSFIKPS